MTTTVLLSAGAVPRVSPVVMHAKRAPVPAAANSPLPLRRAGELTGEQPRQWSSGTNDDTAISISR